MPTFKRRDQEEFEKAKDLLEGAPVAEMGFVKSLFFGRLNLEKVMPYPKQDAADAQRTRRRRDLAGVLLARARPGAASGVRCGSPRSCGGGPGRLGAGPPGWV